MEPFLCRNDKAMFYRYLDNSKAYFEYGSGGSTYQASIRTNLQKIYSVESDILWHSKLKQLIPNNDKIDFIYNEMEAPPNNLGYPGKTSTPIQRKNYSDKILLLEKHKQKQIDLVLIDGRFRVACCLKCFGAVNDSCFIAFDDFFNRPHYHIVLDYYDIVEQTNDNRMVILKKKQDISTIDVNLIQKYEQDSR